MDLSRFPQLQQISPIEQERIAAEIILLQIGINDPAGELWEYVRSLRRENQVDCLKAIESWLIGGAGFLDCLVVATVLVDLGRLGDRDLESFAFTLKAIARHCNRKRPNPYRESFWELCESFYMKEHLNGYQ